MVLIALKCPQCGGEIKLDNVREIGFCMYCGSKIMVDGAIKQEVVIDESGKIDQFTKLGCYALELEKFDEAESYANKIAEIDFNNPVAWMIKGCCTDNEDLAKKYWSKALESSEPGSKTQVTLSELINGSKKLGKTFTRTINLVRCDQRFGCLIPMVVFIDGLSVATLPGPGNSETISIEEGPHRIEAIVGSIRSNIIELDVKEDSKFYFEIISMWTSRIEITKM